MSDIQLYLFEVDKNKEEAKNIAVQSALKLQSKRLKLIDLITDLGEYINNKEDGTLRARSIAYLADVLENTLPQVLSGQERRLLCDFVLGRIEGDLEGIGSSARALIALEDRGKWDEPTAQKVASTFLDHVNPLKQVKLQTDRHAVVQLFDMLVAKYRIPLQHMHERDGEFMSSFVSFFDGEKDPRNLMMIFSILHVPMIEWDVHAHAQDMFEAVFNYFPVAFRPPPDDPYGITAQDLKDRLRDCISANSDFAPFAFPQLLDKLDSSYMNTKRDVLEAIQACAAGYASNTLNLYSVDLWDALKFEILNVQEEDLAEAALKALSILAARFANVDGALNAFLRPIIKECNEHLEDAPTKQSQAAGRILYSVATSAGVVADKISKGVLPALFNLYNTTESIAKRRGLLEVFNEILKAYAELTLSKADVPVASLHEFSAPALEAMLRAIHRAPKSEVSFRLTALEGLGRLLAIPQLLSQEQSYQSVDAVTNIILQEKVQGHGDIRSEAVRELIGMARSSPDAIRDRAIPAFIVELPDMPGDDSDFAPVLEAFARLTTERQVFDTVVRRLKNKLSAARRQHASQTYQRALLLAILYSFTHGSPMLEESGIMRSSYFTEYAEPLISNLQEDLETGENDETLEIVGRISNIILRHQGVHFQNTIYNKYIDWMSTTRHDTTTSLYKAQDLAPFSLYYYAAMRPEVVDPSTIVLLLQAYAASALQTSTPSVHSLVVLRHISLLINKFINPKAMQATLENAQIEVGSLLSTGTNSQSIGLAFSVVKALVVQGKCPALTTKYLQTLLQLLSTSDKAVARRFTGLLGEDDILTKENHCVVSGLYKQKMFNQTVPPIIEAVRTADPSTKPNYLLALSGILRWLPYTMLEPSLPSLIPPLLQTLDLNELSDQEAKQPTLTIFESVLMHDPAVVSEHAASLITRLLNCTVRPANAAGVRAKALQSLALVARQLKREVVVPYRRQVVKKLMPCLDDPKRDVRAAGVRCRTAWLGLDEDEDDE